LLSEKVSKLPVEVLEGIGLAAGFNGMLAEGGLHPVEPDPGFGGQFAELADVVVYFLQASAGVVDPAVDACYLF
jgi:hypothetical protein